LFCKKIFVLFFFGKKVLGFQSVESVLNLLKVFNASIVACLVGLEAGGGVMMENRKTPTLFEVNNPTQYLPHPILSNLNYQSHIKSM
jgi:hypothetical protein